MDFNTIICAVVTLILLPLLWVLKSRSGAAGKSPPQAAGSRFFTGHLHILGGSTGELPHAKLGSLADVHGPIFGINLGLRRAVVVSSSELVRELFTVHDRKVSDRAGLRGLEILTHDYAMLGFTPYGPYWRKIRKLVTIELLSSRRVETMRPVRESEIKAAIKQLHQLSSSSGNAVDLKNWFEDLGFNVIRMVVSGKKFDPAEKLQLIDAVKDFFKFAGTFVAADAWRPLRWLDLGGYEKKMKETAKNLQEIVGAWLTETQRKQHSDKDEPQSFMDVLLSVLPSTELQSNRSALATITATCENMILGAIDTTSVTLTWALSLLLNHPPTLKAAQEELDTKIGRDRLVTESDLPDLVYLQAVVKETLRLYPATPLGSPREFSEDCVVGGFHVRKGTWLIVNLWKLHRDPRFWSDASEFKPERFVGEHKKVDVSGQDFELIPFGAGRRMCVGMHMGLQMVHTVLATLLHAFEIKTVDEEPVDMTESLGLTNNKATPINVVLKPRLAPDVYMSM